MTEADRAGQLGPADLVRLATAASLIGCHTEGIDLLPRANAEYLRLGDVSGALWSAGWLGMRLGHLGEPARSSGWFARAQRLVQQNDEPCPAEGLLLVPPLGDRDAVYGAHYGRGEVQRLRGEFDAAEESYRQANQWGFEPQPGLALLRLAQGKPTAAQSLIRRAIGDADPSTRRGFLDASVEIELAAEEVVAARTAAIELITLARETSMPMARRWRARLKGPSCSGRVIQRGP